MMVVVSVVRTRIVPPHVTLFQYAPAVPLAVSLDVRACPSAGERFSEMIFIKRGGWRTHATAACDRTSHLGRLPRVGAQALLTSTTAAGGCSCRLDHPPEVAKPVRVNLPAGPQASSGTFFGAPALLDDGVRRARAALPLVCRVSFARPCSVQEDGTDPISDDAGCKRASLCTRHCDFPTSAQRRPRNALSLRRSGEGARWPLWSPPTTASSSISPARYLSAPTQRGRWGPLRCGRPPLSAQLPVPGLSRRGEPLP
jgi:hypothetical protein